MFILRPFLWLYQRDLPGDCLPPNYPSLGTLAMLFSEWVSGLAIFQLEFAYEPFEVPLKMIKIPGTPSQAALI